jgi:hypothetical protein
MAAQPRAIVHTDFNGVMETNGFTPRIAQGSLYSPGL